MDSLTLENFRCFRERQTARLAPLTLLVGENSTGKTSFLAMVRAMRELAFFRKEPDFKEEPYDLGSFDEIAHFRGGKAGRADEFMGGVTYFSRGLGRSKRKMTRHRISFTATFKRRGPGPLPVHWKIRDGDTWVEFRKEDRNEEIRFGSPTGGWKRSAEASAVLGRESRYHFRFWPLSTRLYEGEWISIEGSEAPTERDIEEANDLLRPPGRPFREPSGLFASAPVRSKPRRTYDPDRPVPDPEGTYIPMLFADLHFQEPNKWDRLKTALEGFGRAAGLFDEIIVRALGKRGTEPFQLQVRKVGSKRAKGPLRNLIDVGYGVNQVLPVVTELLRSDRRSVHLLQQPEVHLHPSAQAALGSLFCQIAGHQRQLIVETHSDYLLDRIRMEVRDRKGGLKPDDISILYFERQGLDVKIHSLKVDEEGNVLGAPPGYRRFFMEEVSRSIWRHRNGEGT